MATITFSNPFHFPILRRITNFIAIPKSFISCASHTIIGVGGGIGSVLSCGKYPRLNRFTFENLKYSKGLLAQPYKHLLRTINPNAKGVKGISEEMPWIKEKGQDYRDSKNIFKRHVVSRLTFALYAISSLIYRVVVFPIGLIAATFSILIVGKWPELNTLAYTCLQTGGIIEDLFLSTIKFINPWASTN
jgi:hypothetical protein